MNQIVIGVLVVIYLIQIVVVLKELSQGEYTRKYRVLLDLIPFYFLVSIIIEIFIFFYELCLDGVIEEFKKLK